MLVTRRDGYIIEDITSGIEYSALLSIQDVCGVSMCFVLKNDGTIRRLLCGRVRITSVPPIATPVRIVKT